jgi:A/G-specific adenine glycosylase
MSSPAPALHPFSKALLAWYRAHARDLPWRRTRDPYRILLSETMLQQTRVAAALPFYGRFLELFPTVEALAAAKEEDVLTAWSGLGYYARARNLMKAARRVVELRGFPYTEAGLRELPGVGEYTAAAVASICYGQPCAAVDGNVLRVMSRIGNDPGDIGAPSTRKRLRASTEALLDPVRPGEFNQAMMELGATVCFPANPKCLLCPVSRYCQARQAGRERSLPIKLRRRSSREVEKVLLIVEKNGSVLFRRRAQSERQMAGFWELPEKTDLLPVGEQSTLGAFRHAITTTKYRFTVVRRELAGRKPAGWVWLRRSALPGALLSTISRKALAVADSARLRR